GQRLAIGGCLVGHQALAQPLLSEGLGVFLALDQLHTASLTTTTGMHLGLDHPLSTTNGIARLGSCFGSLDSNALGDGKAVLSEQLLPLIFVKVHSFVPLFI